MLVIREAFRIRLDKALDAANMKPIDLAKATGFSESTVSQYRSGRATPNGDRLKVLAKALHVSPAWLMGLDDDAPIGVKKIPLLGGIACGEPILMAEEKELYVFTGVDMNADFALIARGDSMVDARICDGDIVFVKKQPTVENGEIAAVAIDDECLLKKFYKDGDVITLMNAYQKYPPKVYTPSFDKDIRVLGKAVAFQSDLD